MKEKNRPFYFDRFFYNTFYLITNIDNLKKVGYTNLEQARNFALKVVKRKGGKPIVNIYEFDDKVVEKCKRFSSPDDEWLDFVSDNRNGVYKGESYGIIIGPVANDDVYTTLQLYLGGFLTREQTLQILKIKKLYDQYVFARQETMNLLNFKSYEEVK